MRPDPENPFDGISSSEYVTPYSEPVTEPVTEPVYTESVQTDPKAELREKCEASIQKLNELARGRNHTDIGLDEPYFDELKNLRRLQAELNS